MVLAMPIRGAAARCKRRFPRSMHHLAEPLFTPEGFSMPVYATVVKPLGESAYPPVFSVASASATAVHRSAHKQTCRHYPPINPGN